MGRSSTGGLESKKPEEAVGRKLLGNPGPEGLWPPGGWRSMGRGRPGVHPPEITRSLPLVASLHPSGAEAAAAYRALVLPELSAVRKVFCLCGSISNCLGHNRTVKSSALEMGREEDF